eukprot:COSAG01_NODE_3211_length_6414_cov_7.800475_5_plen_142_part_00
MLGAARCGSPWAGVEPSKSSLLTRGRPHRCGWLLRLGRLRSQKERTGVSALATVRLYSVLDLEYSALPWLLRCYRIATERQIPILFQNFHQEWPQNFRKQQPSKQIVSQRLWCDKLTAKLFDFARHENPDSWSDLLTLLKF